MNVRHHYSASPATYSVPPATCEHCRHLLREYDRAVMDFSVNLEAMSGPWTTTSEYQVLKSNIDDARFDAEAARFALERHRITHAISLTAGRAGQVLR
jgi:hypothetical protein